MVDAPFLSGRLLLAMPGMADPRFERAVIAVCVHDANGAVGIGIGHKRAGLRLRTLLKQLELDPGEAPDCAIHHGGPVEPGRGFVLHSEDWGGQDTLDIASPDGKKFCAMTGTTDVLRAIAEGRGPSNICCSGLCRVGRGPARRGNDAPRLVPRLGHPDPVRHPTDERWAAAFRAEGVDPRLLASETERPESTYKEFFIFAFGARLPS